MHFLPLSFKRAHWASIKMLKPMAAKFGLTPARFDLIYCAVRMQGDAYQAPLARKLGVSRTTVCKMLEAMEKAGLVVRLDRNVYDRRHRRWDLTELGRDCFWGLVRFIRRGFVTSAIVYAVARWGRSTDATEIVAEASRYSESVASDFDPDLPHALFPYERERDAADRAATLRAHRGEQARARA